MKKPGKRLRKSLGRAATTYAAALPLAERYLARRGIDLATASRWGLGVVDSTETGHEAFRGRLAIPYVDDLGVYGLKFRCMAEHDCKDDGCAKYLCPTSQDCSLFNVRALDSPSAIIHICEGEMDCLVLQEVLGEPVVGIAGSTAWEDHWPFHFQEYERVILWPDGDKAGRDMAAKWRKQLQDMDVITMPPGHDVGSIYAEYGPDKLKELAGLDDDTEVES
ncbi:toprim domain-containing protein [Longispora urticae]